ncbi:MAG: nicotinate (nicotinamide) nucleotide adenylyltransferase [Fusobacteriaceae bacterium]
MKIGVFGGSFNPIHFGHINIVKIAIEKLKLDKIIVIPVGIPSHRENSLVCGMDRLQMCGLALKNIFEAEISSLEVDSEKKNYTYDTLVEIKKTYPEDEIYEIIGEDSANYFNMWKNYSEILKLSKVVVFKRKNSVHSNSNKDAMLYIEAPYFDYSSTEIRNKIKNKENLENFLPIEVIEYIKKNSLYS